MNSSTSFRPFFLNTNIAAAIDSYQDVLVQLGGNSGNAYIGETVVNHLQPEGPIAGVNNIFTDALDDAALEQAQDASHIILILQDQIRRRISYFDIPPWQHLASFIRKAKKPVVVFSLGANAMPDDPWEVSAIDPTLVQALHVIADHSKSMGIRCNFTADALTQLGIKNFTVTGCPSYFFMGRDRIVRKKDSLKRGDRVIYNGLYVNGTAKKTEYVLQDEPALLRLLLEPQAVSARDALHILSIPTPYRQSVITHILQAKVYCHLGFRQAIVHYQKARFSIGTRLHGSIASLNAGTPTVLTNGDARARGTAEFFGIPYHPGLGISSNSDSVERIDLARLYERLDFATMNAAYPIAYERYRRFFANNDVPFYGDCTNPKMNLKRKCLPSIKCGRKSKERLREALADLGYDDGVEFDGSVRASSFYLGSRPRSF